MRKIAFISLGCDKNLVDTEVALGKLLSRGYNFFSSPEEDVYKRQVKEDRMVGLLKR